MSEILQTVWRILTFRFTREDIDRLDNRYLTFGVIATWIVGMGRYWDNTRAEFLQHLGVGSVVYIFILALYLFLILWPLRPQNWSYKNLLIFISLTAPPAILYAIPIEMFMPLALAQSVNAIFLGIVAVWRVALLGRYLYVYCEMRGLGILVALLFPLTGLVSALAALNLEHAVFQVMAGINDNPESSADVAYQVLFVITLISWLLFPILAFLYVVEIARQRDKRKTLPS